MLKEFKEFAMKGNVLDLAVGVIIGAAFGKIVSSLVSDIIMPMVGLLLGRVNFSTLAITIGSARIGYGVFLQTVVDFLIVAFVIFLMVKQANKLRKNPVPAAPTEKLCSFCQLNVPIKATRCPHCTSQLV
jgi:large conductance mechanosensitive channel